MGFQSVKHKSLDLASEIRRASLPTNLEGFLFPVFEAISNSLHSIEDRFQDQSYEKGLIRIVIDIDGKSITVSDNGDGLNKINLDAFLTPFTGHKFRRNGKGFGRFISFKMFEKVYYASPTEVENGEFRNLVFEYKPLDPEDNLVEITSRDVMSHHAYDRGVTVAFHQPKEAFETFFSLGEKRGSKELSEESFLLAILDHFLLEFIQKKAPRDFVCEIAGAAFNLSEYFTESVVDCGVKPSTIRIDENEHQFNLHFMQIDAKKSKRHNLYFYSDNRATSDLENISKGLKDGSFEGENGRRYHYLVAVSSDYFKSSQSRDRIENLVAKVDQDGRSVALKDFLCSAARTHILDLEPRYTKKRRASIRKNVEELIALDPMLRRGLGEKTIEEFVNERGITESKEQIASDLFVIRLRNKFDFKKINSKTPFEELQKVVQKNIPDDAKEALAVYVAYRNDVIKVLKEMLSRQEDGLAREDAVHQLVYPRYRDSDEVDYSSHNLWLIDDDLAFAEYISSDRTTSGRRRGSGQYAHDLLVNNQNELLLVEMKRPQKDKYDETEDAKSPTDNPVQQLISQVAQIRDEGKITTSGGRHVVIPGDKMVRGYILADWNDELREYLMNNDFIVTDHGGPMAYRYYTARNLMIEVLAFDRLTDRAAKRNQVFVQILEGQSDYRGGRVTRLAGE